jgi:hypothetical protein
VDPRHIDADPDPACQFDADLGAASDPVLEFLNNIWGLGTE